MAPALSFGFRTKDYNGGDFTQMMPSWWPFGRKRKRAPAAPNTPLSRRAVLKWGLALGGTALASAAIHRVVQRGREKQTLKQAQIDAINHLSPISTRKPHSFREVIESTPDIATSEAGWYKQRGKPGQVRRADLSRGKRVELVPWSDTDSSEIHTHPLLLYPKDMPLHLKERAASALSRPDLIGIISANREYIERETTKKPLYKTHVAAVDGNGKVMGYYSIYFGKRSRERALLTWMQMVNAPYKFELELAYSKKDWKMVEDALDRHDKFMKKCQEKGLRIRAKAMPGFVYKDGRFQAKS